MYLQLVVALKLRRFQNWIITTPIRFQCGILPRSLLTCKAIEKWSGDSFPTDLHFWSPVWFNCPVELVSVVAAWCMRRTPAPPVPRERSRSPLSRRLQGVLGTEGHIGVVFRRRRERGQSIVICLRSSLSTLFVSLHFLTQGQLGVDSLSRGKIKWGKGCGFLRGWPDSKRIVLPRLEEYLRENQEEVVSIDRVSEVETIVFLEPPPEGDPPEDSENPFGDPFSRQVFERTRGGFTVPAHFPVDPNSFLGQRLGRDLRFRREGDPIPHLLCLSFLPRPATTFVSHYILEEVDLWGYPSLNLSDQHFISPSAYADNWSWILDVVADHLPTLQATIAVTRSAGVSIDWAKTWFWPQSPRNCHCWPGPAVFARTGHTTEAISRWFWSSIYIYI